MINILSKFVQIYKLVTVAYLGREGLVAVPCANSESDKETLKRRKNQKYLN